MEERLVYFTSVLVAGIAAQWLAWRFKLPSILLLLGFGFAAGRLISPDEFITEETLFPLVSMSVAIILLEGGLTLKFSELKESGKSVLRLVTLGAVVSWALSTLAAHYAAGLHWEVSLLLGAILVVTGPTVIGPLLRVVKPNRRVGSILKWEGIVIDPIGAILAVLVFQAFVATTIGKAAQSVFVSLTMTIVVGLGLGYATARLLQFLLKRHWIPDFLQSVVLLTAGLGVFAISNHIQKESGLLTVTVLGIALANQKHAPVRHLLEFKENLRVILISCLFIVLAGRVAPADLREVWVGALIFLAALIFIIRPASVFLSTWGTGLKFQEKLFLSFVAPRGIVAAAVSAVFALELTTHLYGDGQEAMALDAAKLVPLTFLVIVGTVTFYGLTAGPLARKLKLAVRNPQGILFAGVHRWVIEAGVILQDLGFRVLLVDSNYGATTRSRMAGLTTINASILSEFVTEETDLTGIGQVLAVTPNDQINSMACLAFSHPLGRSHVYQLKPHQPDEKSRGAVSQELMGRLLFPGNPSYQALVELEAQGATVKKTKITEEFTMEHFKTEYGASALMLFHIKKTSGELRVCTDESFTPSPGDTIITLVPAEGVARPVAM